LECPYNLPTETEYNAVKMALSAPQQKLLG
jgi:hypothetical protein